MKDIRSKIGTIISWLFVVFCLLMAIGVGFGAGCILLIVTAIIAMPLKPIRELWEKVLGIHEIEPVDETEAKFWQFRKRKVQRNYKKEKENQKSRRLLKPVIIVLAFFISFGIGAAGMEPSNETTSRQLVASESLQAETLEEIESETESTTTETETIVETEAESSTEAESVTETESEPIESTFSVRFIDVGQADAALVECDGHYMLIDGGDKSDSQLIYTVLKNESVEKLDIVVGSHAHADHIGGIPGAFNYANADLTLCPVTNYDSDEFADFLKYANSNGGGITVPSVGDHYTLGSSDIAILGVNSGSDVNDTSIVLKITYGKTAFIFTGDAEKETEQTIIDSGEDLSATVLKVGHHGSENSTTDAFLKKVNPSYAIISVGKDNPYGHPTEANLSRLQASNVEIFRTDLNGDILAVSDGNDVTISTEKEATKEAILTYGGYQEKESQVETESQKIAEQQTTVAEENVEKNEPSGTDYVVNTSTKKFHYPSCSSVKKMKESNTMYYTGTRDELIDRGYSPCGKCHP